MLDFLWNFAYMHACNGRLAKPTFWIIKFNDVALSLKYTCTPKAYFKCTLHYSNHSNGGLRACTYVYCGTAVNHMHHSFMYFLHCWQCPNRDGNKSGNHCALISDIFFLIFHSFSFFLSLSNRMGRYLRTSSNSFARLSNRNIFNYSAFGVWFSLALDFVSIGSLWTKTYMHEAYVFKSARILNDFKAA